MSFDSGFMESVVKRGTVFLDDASGLLKGISLNAKPDPGNKGDSYTVTDYGTASASAITASFTTPAATAVANASKTVSLDYNYKADFDITGSEWTNNQLSYSFENMLKERIRACVAAVSADVHSQYYKVSSFVGVAGRSFFNNGTINSIDSLSDLNKVLNDNKVPEGDRQLILSNTEAGNYGKVAAVQYQSYAGDVNTRSTGMLGMDSGIMMRRDSSVASHTVGTITTGLIAKAATAVAAGTTSFVATTAASTGACALKKGDIISIAHASGSRNYSVQADVTQASAATDTAAITLDRGLEFALVGSEAVTIATNFGTGSTNIGGNLQGFEVFNRIDRLVLDGHTNAKLVLPITHAESGLTLLFSQLPGYHLGKWELSIMWGSQVVQSKLLCRCIGV
jgi:hypothetical protein